jgi:hypothetical protein
MLVLDPGPYQRIRCDERGYPVCQLICRKFDCQRAYHAKCFSIDQRRWPSVMNEGDGLHLRENDDVLGCFMCPPCVVVDCAYEGRPAPTGETRTSAELLEKTRQFMYYRARSSASTVNNIASGVRRLTRFEKVMGLPVTPVAFSGDYEVVALGWYFVARASKVKVQSLSGDRPAVAAIFDASMASDGKGLLNPLLSSAGGARSARAARSMLGATLLAAGPLPRHGRGGRS